MRMSRRLFFASLSGFATSALLGGILPGQSMARPVGSQPARLAGQGLARACSIVACGGGGCNLLEANAERLMGRTDLFAVDLHAKYLGSREGLDTRFGSHAHIKTYAIEPVQNDALLNLERHALGLRSWPDEELAELINVLGAAGSPVIIVACLGRSTGSLAANALAAACQHRDLPVQAIVTTPFHFETRRSSRVAKVALGQLARHADALHVLSNQMPLHLLEQPVTLHAAFNVLNTCFAKHLDIALEFADAHVER